jgi:protein-S-isoprenylcysteine O-methyltransferase Ste14
MSEEERFVIKIPKGIKPKHLAIIAIFGLLIYLLVEALKSVFVSGFSNPNYAIVVIALILVVICILTVFVIRTILREDEQKST